MIEEEIMNLFSNGILFSLFTWEIQAKSTRVFDKTMMISFRLNATIG